MTARSASTSWPISARAPEGALRRLLSLLLLCAVLGSAERVHAHADLDEAKRLVNDLEFEASLLSFEAALKSGTLAREELLLLLSERAFVFHALRRQDELIKDFIWLSALAPDYRLDMRAPPDLTATWTSVRDQGRGALQVELSAYANAEGVVDARASLTGTVPEGAQARLWLRRGKGAFSALRGAELHESGAGDAELAFYADFVALGGVVLPGEHSAQNPLRVQTGHGSASGHDGERSWASRHKGWLIGGAVVIAAGIVVTGVLLGRSDPGHSDKTNLKPMVTF